VHFPNRWRWSRVVSPFPHALASRAIGFFPMSHPWHGTCHKPRHSVWERSQKGVTSPGTPLEVTYLTCHVANMPSAMSLSDIPMPKKVITDVTSADIAKSQERERERELTSTVLHQPLIKIYLNHGSNSRRSILAHILITMALDCAAFIAFYVCGTMPLP